jgi:hypothetical protein
MPEASAPVVAEDGREMVAFLGVPADKRLLGEVLLNLFDAEQHRRPVVPSQGHDRLAGAGPLLTVARACTSNPTQSSFQPWPDVLNYLRVSRRLLSSQTNRREERPST